MKARLKSSGFLKRIFSITTAERNYEIIYEGGNIGYESVQVNGLLVAKKRAWLWMTPTFDFMIGSLPARIAVSFWPWLSGFKSLKLYLYLIYPGYPLGYYFAKRAFEYIETNNIKLFFSKSLRI